MAMGNISAGINVDDPPLRELNSALRVLVEMFPNIQPEVFREMLLNTSEESRLDMVTENLLRDEHRCVRGRVRVPGADDDHALPSQPGKGSAGQGTLKSEERFRSVSYKTAVTDALSQEFKGLSRSVLRAVLAECNYHYSQSRDRLLDLSAKSWRVSVTRFLFRRRTPAAGEHPLVIWELCGPGSASFMQPTLRFTPSTELNLELWNTLVQPVLEEQKSERLLQDKNYALKVNEEQAEKLGELYDCGCCFVPYPMEQLTSCTDQGHYICYTCICHTVNEALFGQGWAKSIDHDRCTVKCVAPTSTTEARCEGFITSSMVQLALEEAAANDMWEKLHGRCASEALLHSSMPLVRCPFCTYAELDDFAMDKVQWNWHPLPTAFLATCLGILWFLLTLSTLRYLLQPAAFTAVLYVAVKTATSNNNPLMAWVERSLLRITRKRRGLKFVCQAPSCSRASCLNCRKAWSDIHVCYESSKMALRAAIEAATTEVVKRTCPVCSLSFVKAAGCNKLACVCGYTMCYVCRQQIGKESYTHFCQHFRQRPGEPCVECDKCDLYKVDDEDVLIREAALRAEKEWWEREERTAEGAARADSDQVAKKNRLNALERDTLSLTSSNKVHAFIRALCGEALWDSLLDRLLSKFVE